MSIPKENDVYAALRKRFPEEAYTLLFEVRDRAGFGASRSADGIAMSLWPSRGLEVHGIEIKSYRGDWLRELKNPQKAEAIFKFCDRWWVVASEVGIVKPEEVPKTWGLLVNKNGKLYSEVEAPKLNPLPMDRSFVAALLKRATSGMISVASITDRIEEGRRSGEKLIQSRWDRDKVEFSRLKEAVATFEAKSGVRISAWDADRIGGAVRFVMDGGIGKIRNELLDLKKKSNKINEYLSQILPEENKSKDPE